MAEPRFLMVKNFAEFQHYRDRSPIWIKLYARLLNDVEFLTLSDSAQLCLIKLWLLASQTDNKLPNDAKFLSAKISARGKLPLAELIAAGFLVPWQPASKSASGSASTDASNGASTPASSAASQPASQPASGFASPRALAREEKRRGEKRRKDAASTSASSATAPAAAAASSNSTHASRGHDGDAVFATIRALAREKPSPGVGKYIPRTEVEALGSAAIKAYDAIGGASRILENLDNGREMSFVAKDFAKAYAREVA